MSASPARSFRFSNNGRGFSTGSQILVLILRRPERPSRRMRRSAFEAPSCFETGSLDPPQHEGLDFVHAFEIGSWRPRNRGAARPCRGQRGAKGLRSRWQSAEMMAYWADRLDELRRAELFCPCELERARAWQRLPHIISSGQPGLWRRHAGPNVRPAAYPIFLRPDLYGLLAGGHHTAERG